MFAFDQWILDKCEKFSHKIQRTFGITCFGLARICLILSFLLFSVSSFYEYWLWGIIAPLVSLMPALDLYQRTFYVERRTASLALRGLANPGKNDGVLRLVSCSLIWFLLMLLFSMGGSAIYYFFLVKWVILLILHLYFMACNPLPPAKSRVRVLIEKIRESLIPHPEPIPQES